MKEINVNRPLRRNLTIGKILAGLAGLIVAAALQGAMATAAMAAPELRLDSEANTTVAPGEIVWYELQLTNVGDTTTSGQYQIEVSLPPELSAAGFLAFTYDDCNAAIGADPRQFTCTSSFPLDPHGVAFAWLGVLADPGAAGEATSEFAVSGGGAAPSTDQDAILVTTDAPEFGLESADGGAFRSDGSVVTEAGAAPDNISTSLSFNTFSDPGQPDTGLPNAKDLVPVESARDAVVDLPVGLVGGVKGIPECTFEQLASDGLFAFKPICPMESQVGTVRLHLNIPATSSNAGPVPIYNIVRAPDAAASFGFSFGGVITTLDATVRTGSDYGLTVRADQISQGLSPFGTDVSFWGVPADPVHDSQRACPGQPYPEDGTGWGGSFADPPFGDPSLCPYERPEEEAVLRLPTSCTGPVDTEVHVASWENPAVYTSDGRPDLDDPSWKSTSFTSHETPGAPLPASEWGDEVGMTGCGAIPFNPQVSVETTSTEADSPTGLAVDISIPQSSNPFAVGSSDLKNAQITLPEGFTVNPSSADGLKACSLQEVDLDSNNTPADCPNASKQGTVDIDTPLLDDPLTGSVYLAEPDDPDKAGQENPFDSLVALYIVAEGPGTVIKLPGKVDLDPDTGQVRATFKDNPQLPFSNMHVEFFDGPRSPIATPPTCSSGAVTAELTPWARPNSPVMRTENLAITSMPGGTPCVEDLANRPFDPTMNAGVKDPVAGSFTPFVFQLKRDDGHQEILSTDVTPPEGVTAKLAGTPLCTDAQADAGNCPAASRIGTMIVGAGAGSSPFYIQAPNEGKVFLTGPYKGAPLGMLIQVPAIAGPFDLGLVNVRAAVQVDPQTAQLTVRSDEIPQILEGIPLRVRDIRVRIDREGFTVAPTDCSEKEVLATAHGSHGAEAKLTNRFQVGECDRLSLNPRLGLRLVGKKQTREGGHPALRAKLTQMGDQSNIRRARVVLPKSVALDARNANNPGLLCSFEAGQAADCPRSSIIGRAVAVSPLLNRPLRGPVHFVQGIRVDKKTGNRIRTLPTLLVKLKGEIELHLRARSNVSKGRLVTTFPVVPDARVKTFRLNLAGGKRKGILVATGRPNLCQGAQRSRLTVRGHDGKLTSSLIRIKTPCGKKPKRRLNLRRPGRGSR